MTVLALLAITGTATLVVGCRHMDRDDSCRTTNHFHRYSCNMHPEVVQSTPGNCPKCGMALVHSD